jgi:hypothetical protein
MSNTAGVGVGESESVLSDIASSAGEAIRRGSADARAAAERSVPVIKRSVAKSVYVCCYYLSFGAVYTGELAMEAVPADSPIRHGLADGARAAREARRHARHGQVLLPDELAAEEIDSESV